MVHYVVAVIAEKDAHDNFYYWLANRQHMSSFPNHPGILIKPNVREVRLYDVSTFESCAGQLLRDLSPYNASLGDRSGILNWGAGVVRKLFGLTCPPSSSDNPIPERWREYMHVMILGSKNDPVENGETAELKGTKELGVEMI